MRKNAFPIIVPCHRVVSAGGLGGFTGPQGVSTKVQLQAVEKVGVAG
jgi:O6-methylguanine-DNA--protein-cysteine methyltransferase